MPIPLRDDFDAAEVRREAKKSKDGGQARRLLALAAIYDGSTRREAAKIGGVTLQIVRDWVLKFNAHGPSGLIAGKAPGQTPRPIIHKLHAEFDRALQSPDVRDRHAKLGADPMPMSPEQFDAQMREDLATLGALLRAAGVKAN